MTNFYSRGGKQQGDRDRILLHVYDLSANNDTTYFWGFGAFHSGVEIQGTEWTFGGNSGVFSMEPKNVPNARFRETIDMGTYSGSSKEFSFILDELRSDFLGSSYNIITRNCNHFSEALIRRLNGRMIPAYVNRLAYFGSFCTCLVPPSMTGAPVDGAPSKSSSSPMMPKSSPFAGKGYKLGAVDHQQDSERLLGSSSNSSSNNNSNTTSNSRDNMRDKAREAAILRLSQGS